jgi:hypothetical protein
VWRTKDPNNHRSFVYTYDPTKRRVPEPRVISRKNPLNPGYAPSLSNGNNGERFTYEPGFLLEHIRTRGGVAVFQGEDGSLWAAKRLEI